MSKRVRGSFSIQLLETYLSPSETQAQLKTSILSAMVGDTVGIGEGEELLISLPRTNQGMLQG